MPGLHDTESRIPTSCTRTIPRRICLPLLIQIHSLTISSSSTARAGPCTLAQLHLLRQLARLAGRGHVTPASDGEFLPSYVGAAVLARVDVCLLLTHFSFFPRSGLEGGRVGWFSCLDGWARAGVFDQNDDFAYCIPTLSVSSS